MLAGWSVSGCWMLKLGICPAVSRELGSWFLVLGSWSFSGCWMLDVGCCSSELPFRGSHTPASAVLFDIVPLQPQSFGRVQHQHFHPNIGWNLSFRQLRYRHHENDRQRHRPDGGLFADDSQKRMAGPKGLQWQPFQI